MAPSSPFSVRTRVCHNKCAPSLDHCMCCFLQNRLLTTSFGSATEVMLTTRFRATVGQKPSCKQGVTRSYGRQRHLPHVWIASVQEKWPHPSWQTESSG